MRWKKARSAVTRQKDHLSAAVEAGKQAYRDAVSTAPAGDVSEGI